MQGTILEVYRQMENKRYRFNGGKVVQEIVKFLRFIYQGILGKASAAQLDGMKLKAKERL